MKNRKLIFFIGAALVLVGAILYDAKHNFVDWRTANRGSAGLAPDPKQEKEAVVQIYAARTYNWRGYFAVHPWIAVKPKNAAEYTTYQIIGFYLRRNGSALTIQKDIPDRYWYGNEPMLLQTLKGAAAEKAIPAIEKAVKTYPYSKEYHLWPGPNSNTFVAYVIRHVPELTVELPPNALGKDFLGYTTFFAKSESGTGYQFSLLGFLGLIIGINEGIEINIMSMVLGIDFKRPAIKLPFIGRIGMKDE